MQSIFRAMFCIPNVRLMCTTTLPSKSMKKRKRFSFIFLSRLVGMDREICKKIVNQVPAIKHASKADLKKCLSILTKAGYPLSYVQQYLALLSVPPEILNGNLMFCQECGCFNDKVGPVILNLNNFVGMRISLLKAYKVIPETVRVSDSFLYYLGVPIGERNKLDYHDDLSIKECYESVFNYYLGSELGVDEETVKKLRKGEQYTSVRILHKNLYIMKKMFGYTNEKLLEMPHLLHANPDNITTVLKSQHGIKFKESMYTNPSLMTVPIDDIVKVNQLLQKYGVDPSVLIDDPEIYNMTNEELLYRLQRVIQSPYLNVYKDHPRLPVLLRGSRVANERLSILEKFNMKCFNINLLTGHTQTFFRHIVHGVDKASSADVITYVSKQLGKPFELVKRELKKHAYLEYVPILTFQDNLLYLYQAGFNNDDIFAAVQVLLYPKLLIQQKLNDLIMNPINVNDFQEIQVVKKKHFLPLILYFIEKDFNFTGSGIVNRNVGIHVEGQDDSHDQKLLTEN